MLQFMNYNIKLEKSQQFDATQIILSSLKFESLSGLFYVVSVVV